MRRNSFPLVILLCIAILAFTFEIEDYSDEYQITDEATPKAFEEIEENMEDTEDSYDESNETIDAYKENEKWAGTLMSSEKPFSGVEDSFGELQPIIYDSVIANDQITLAGTLVSTSYDAQNESTVLPDGTHTFSVDDDTCYQIIKGENPYNVTQVEFMDILQKSIDSGYTFEVTLHDGCASTLTIRYN